ncbi:MAG: recombination-associated protein RdgC, partial [Steroidobacteraceae bacterium]
MFFRNLTMFRFPRMLDLTGLPEGVAGLQLKPVGPLELSSRGFVSPFGRDSDILHRQIGTAIWISVATEDKILPGAVVANAVAERLAEMEKTEGRKLGGRARKRLKEGLVHELLPRAFVKPGRTDALIDFDLGIIVVDTSSRKAAEAIVSDIRHAIGSFPALPINAELAPRAVLTGWIA